MGLTTKPGRARVLSRACWSRGHRCHLVSLCSPLAPHSFPHPSTGENRPKTTSPTHLGTRPTRSHSHPAREATEPSEHSLPTVPGLADTSPGLVTWSDRLSHVSKWGGTNLPLAGTWVGTGRSRRLTEGVTPSECLPGARTLLQGTRPLPACRNKEGSSCQSLRCASLARRDATYGSARPA